MQKTYIILITIFLNAAIASVLYYCSQKYVNEKIDYYMRSINHQAKENRKMRGKILALKQQLINAKKPKNPIVYVTTIEEAIEMYGTDYRKTIIDKEQDFINLSWYSLMDKNKYKFSTSVKFRDGICWSVHTRGPSREPYFEVRYR